jgi:2-dehydro-3-deoxyphosphogluconate aldolase/(4S)-4-hydroxy-2-oxoglutarate aldolase
MPHHSKAQVLEQIHLTPFFVFFYHADLYICRKVVRACYEGGIRVFEFTNRGENAPAVFAELRPWANDEFPDLVFGAGTIYRAAEAEHYIGMGADFIVSPAVDEAVARKCRQHEVPWIPGCLTPTEIHLAEQLGAAIIKIFPVVASGGPDYIRAMHGPSPHTRFMPTGQLKPTEESLKPWLEAGAYCVGLGSGLVTREIIQNAKFDKLANLCADTLQIINNHRNTYYT